MHNVLLIQFSIFLFFMIFLHLADIYQTRKGQIEREKGERRNERENEKRADRKKNRNFNLCGIFLICFIIY